MRRACPRRSGLPALALAAAARQIRHTALALSLCTPRFGRRGIRNGISMVFFFSVALQHDQWHNMLVLQFYVGASKKVGQCSFCSSVLQRRQIFGSAGDNFSLFKRCFAFLSQVVMAVCCFAILSWPAERADDVRF